MQDAAEKIRQYILSEFGLEPKVISPETPLFSSGLLDSFSMVELLNYIEGIAGWKFRVVDVNLENLDSIDRIIRFLNRKEGSG